MKKNRKLPHVYVLLLLVMFFVLILTYVVPSGEFTRVVDPNSGRQIIDPGTYATVDKTPVGILSFFKAIHVGFAQTVDIIALVIFVAASLAVIEKTGAIGAGIYALVDKMKGKDTLLLILLTTVFSFLGAIGFAEGGTPFVPLAVTLGVALGYDKIVGAGAGILGLAVGFTSGVLNLYTTGVAQSIAGLPLYSGMNFRIISWFVFTAMACIYVVSYAKKTKQDPTKSILYGKKGSDVSVHKKEDLPLTNQRKLILIALLITFGFQIYGTLKLGWYLQEITAIYLMLAIVAGLIYKMSTNDIATTFAKGGSDILPASLAIGLARGILVIMNEGKILDTAINGLTNFLNGRSSVMIVVIVYIATVLFNFFVTSGSGKAVILMPILGPLGQIMGINQQVMVIAYQFGDGFTNYFFPTAGTLMAALALADVEYEDWFKFSYKFFIAAIIVGGIATVIAQVTGLGPF